MSPDREAALVEKARAASTAPEREAAFAELFEAMKAQVLILCLHLTGSGAEAEDAFQDTFISVHQGIRDFRGEARLSTWVYRIAVRAALAVSARGRRTEPFGDAALAAADPRALPDQAAAARQDLARFHAAMAKLSAEHRTVLSLFAIDGLSHRGIADVLGVSEGTIWSRLYRARERLGELLRE